MSNLTAQAARVVRPGWLHVPFARTVLAAHDIQTALPAALRATIAKGFLERTFLESMRPAFLYGAVADVQAFEGGIGDQKTMTRAGLLAPASAAITPGSDAPTGTYAIEQWSVTLDKYGLAVDTDMLASRAQLASKFTTDISRLGINAGQSINQVARNKLYGAYAGGRTWATGSTSSSTTLPVADTSGFGVRSVNGVLTPVSGSNALAVTVNGVANTVTGVSVASGPGNLALGTAVSASAGWAVVASNAPTVVRAGSASSPYGMSGSDVVTFAMFRSSVARLRKMNVPTVNGSYVAHIDADTETQLFADSEFKQLYQGRADSAVYRDLSIGVLGGIDFVRNTEAPTVAGGSSGTVTVRRPIVMGANALVATPMAGLTDLLRGTGVEAVPNISTVNAAPGVDVALIVRPPQDRFQQIVGSAWQWVGDYAVPTDLNAAVQGGSDPALYKRAVILEHA
jgi:hypothetical protein